MVVVQARLPPPAVQVPLSLVRGSRYERASQAAPRRPRERSGGGGGRAAGAAERTHTYLH